MRAEDLPVAPRLVTTEEQIQFALDGRWAGGGYRGVQEVENSKKFVPFEFNSFERGAVWKYFYNKS